MKLLLPLLFLFILTGCYESSRNCTDFNTGQFKSTVTINEKTYLSTFSRSQNLQVETYDGKTDSSKVRWINDCEAVFTTIRPKNRTERKDIHLKILTTTDSSYTFEYSYVGEVNKQKGVAIKITE
ncbi:DNA topoisomerase IV [Aurantibacter aestuarii]|uniref:DNA topoisomerase IV n=1 Tax=Aurantibacter aestuarii TaxID=1266046 RepID=A0A2T1N8C5_9FLAO|nr:DNA topoisomerase IV [Aurantibacter aestuarii]PSG88121.1 DNA topoisomerase IV [Aurantibacter aestuarii]